MSHGAPRRQGLCFYYALGRSGRVVYQVGARFVATHPAMPPVPASASTAFVSAELVDTMSNVINNGIRLGPGLGKGTFYVQVESQGFGGVLSIRYRR